MNGIFFPIEGAEHRWTFAVPDVPAGREHVIAVADPNACSRTPVGSSNTTEGVFANGVRLTRTTNFPFGSTPALLFTVSADGRVSP